MFRVILQKFVIFLVYQFFVEGKDLLNHFRPKPDLPQELNDFLNDVQQHKKDFAFIRNVAKNRRKYEKSFEENHNLFAEDLDNQLTLTPYYNKRLENFDNQNGQFNMQSNLYEQNARSPEFSPEISGEDSFRSYNPSERYSKFIHSPVRLTRELDSNYLNSHVKVDPNSVYGEIRRFEPKFPRNRFISDNKYPTGLIVGMEDDDDYNDYPELRPTDKKKREVEISIKSDGKLVKRIEENENGPKSIILNIKASNANEKSQILGNSASQAAEPNNAVELSTISVQPAQVNKNVDNGPSNSKTIPSIANTNTNQNGPQNKNIGVPINSIPASNSAISNKNEGSSFQQQVDSSNNLNAKQGIESVNQDTFLNKKNANVPEESKASNYEDIRQKLDLYNSKSLGGFNKQLENNVGNLRWSGDSNQMAKSIDIAQNNINRFSGIKDKLNMEADPDSKNDSDFEKVQGLVVDSTSINNNIKENKVNSINKRQSAKKKRWDEIQKSMDVSNLPLYIPEIQSEGTVNGGLDFAKSLEQDSINLNNLGSGQENPESVHWDAADHEIHLNPNQKYEIIEHSTKNILILPIIDTTTCEIDLHVPPETNSNKEEKEEAKIIEEAVEQEIDNEKEAEAKHEYEETTECASEKHPKHEEEEIEIIGEERNKEHKHHKHGPTKDSNEKIEEIEIVRKDQARVRHQRQENYQNHEKKRQIVKKKKPKYIIKPKGSGRKPNYSPDHYNGQVPYKLKNQEEQPNHLADNAFRNRKHLPPIPKYKKKRVRQHPKKRVDRVIEPSLVDYYAFNELYGPPEDTFDFIPSFHKRQLKSVNYEFDPNLIQDVGNHEEQEFRKFEIAQEEKGKIKTIKSKGKDQGEKKFQKSQGYRKKFKSEGDYSDEEESITIKSGSKKVPIKKTQNEFAPAVQTTTEDNDDDYNYEDMADMEDEEDVAYEEEKTNDIEVDEQIGSYNRSEDENDRLNLNAVMTVYIAMPKILLDSTTKLYAEKSIIIESFPTVQKIDKNLLKNEDEAELDQDKQVPIARGHGSANKKRKMKNKMKKPKRNDENNRIMKAEDKDLAEDVSSFHGRGNSGFKIVKRKKIKPKREDDGQINQRRNDLGYDKRSEQFEEKPLSNQQKQDIFLRYNPDFQRWPRFVQSDNNYRELMKRRSLENQQKFFRNSHNMNRFPISNEYFLNPEKPDFVKREEPVTEGKTVAASSIASEAASSPASEETKAAAAVEGATQSSTAESFAEEKEQASETQPNMETECAPLAIQEKINDGTLPQAAKNILQTANSDIFENTTVPSLECAENGNNSVVSGGGQGVQGESTKFQFTTNSDDLTENTECLTSPHKEMNACSDEGASHSPVTITSVLPLVLDSATMFKVNMTKSEYLDLNDIVGGTLPRHIVSNSLSSARGSVRRGLNSGKFNTNLNLSNYNSSAETKMILNEMTNLMLKLKYHTTCQALPPNLKTYIKLITKNEMDSPMAKLKEMEDIDFDEHQSSYVFHTEGSESIQNKANVLKELLNKYNNLPDNCKEKAEPVREYIESHLAMIEKMGGKGGSKTLTGATLAENGTTVHPKAKKEINLSNANIDQEKDLNGQMIEEGLNNPKPDANEAIEDKEKKNKREATDSKFPPVYGRELSTSTSPQYGKLAEAVRKLRHRRENVKRIGEIYGRAKREEINKIENDEQPYREDKGFESPIVINF